MTTPQVIAAFLAADLLTGIFHWWEDRYGNPAWPVLGKYVIQPNIEHHSNQMSFTHGNYFTRNWTTILATVPIAVFASQSNEIHCWSHQKCSRPIRGLQLLGILQSPEQHARHHTRPFDRNYCVMTDVLNPVLQAVGFWQALEWCIGLAGVHPRLEREVA